MFITGAPWRIISLTSLPEPSCSFGKTVILTLPLARSPTFLAKYTAATFAGSVVDSECASLMLISCADAPPDDREAAASPSTAMITLFIRLPPLDVFVLAAVALADGRRHAEWLHLRRAGVEDLGLTLEQRGMEGDGVGGEIGAWRRLVLEIAVLVDAANQRRAVGNA